MDLHRSSLQQELHKELELVQVLHMELVLVLHRSS